MSKIYDLCRDLAGGQWTAAREEEISFYRNLLTGMRPGDLIFDVGANVGMKTDVFLRLGARVVAIEPDETNQSILRESFLRFRFVRKPVVIVDRAVSDEDTVATMWIDGPGSAVNTLSAKWADTLRENKARHVCGHCGLDFTQRKTVKTTTLESLIAEYGLPIFVKIDVEGHELSVIRGLRRPIPHLSFEVNLPEFRSEAVGCVELLADLAPNGRFSCALNKGRPLTLDQWLDADEFIAYLEKCTEGCIEVFWKGLVSGTT